MFSNLTIKQRLIFLVGVLVVILLITSGIALTGLKESNDSVEAVYGNRLISIKSLGLIRAKAIHNRLLISASLVYNDEAKKNVELIEKNLAEMKVAWDTYAAAPTTPDESVLIKKYLADRKQYVDEALNPALAIMRSNDLSQLDEHIITKVRPLYTPFYEDLEGLIQLNDDAGKVEYEESQARFKLILWSLIGLVLFGLVTALILSNKIIARILKSIREVQNVADAIAHGDLTSKIDTDVQDETGAMFRAMQTMQKALVNLVEAQQVMAKKHADGWIKEQIDATKFQGSYKTLAESINHLVQAHIAVKMQIVDVVTQYSKGNFEPNMERLPGDKAKITEAMDAVKNAFLAVSKEVEMIAAAGAQGDFSKRAKAEKFEFMFKTMLSYLNTFVETSEVGFNDVLRVANALADGDLTQTITKDYPGVFGQVKVGMNNTTENLKNLMSEVRETSETINSAAKEIAAGNNDLSHRTEEQAASLEETAASMHELTSTVEHNSANAKQASELAIGATEIAHKGVSVVEQVVSTMENINESSLRIVDIISVIDDIAFQTNILALNAAVEAARAGEQGKGFAVVATEVRNLAQRAANAAGEIKRLIGDSVERVSGGSKQVAEAGKTMQDIVEAIQNVNKIISEIASASVEQNAGIAQVGQAIGSMDEVTQQNAALVEQVAATAETLESQTSHLAREMAHFKTDASHSMSSSATKNSAKTSSPAKKSTPAVKPMAVAKDDFGSKGSFSVGNDDDWEEF